MTASNILCMCVKQFFPRSNPRLWASVPTLTELMVELNNGSASQYGIGLT